MCLCAKDNIAQRKNKTSVLNPVLKSECQKGGRMIGGGGEEKMKGYTPLQ